VTVTSSSKNIPTDFIPETKISIGDFLTTGDVILQYPDQTLPSGGTAAEALD
jgi:MOSC domain-containing protein YiiM